MGLGEWSLLGRAWWVGLGGWSLMGRAWWVGLGESLLFLISNVPMTHWPNYISIL